MNMAKSKEKTVEPFRGDLDQALAELHSVGVTVGKIDVSHGPNGSTLTTVATECAGYWATANTVDEALRLIVGSVIQAGGVEVVGDRLEANDGTPTTYGDHTPGSMWAWLAERGEISWRLVRKDHHEAGGIRAGGGELFRATSGQARRILDKINDYEWRLEGVQSAYVLAIY